MSDEANKLTKGSEKLNKLYMSALKSIVKEKKDSGRLHGKVAEDQREIYKQRAAFRALLKTPGKKIFLKSTHGRNKIPVIYMLTPGDIKKWAKSDYDLSQLEHKRVGRLVFETYQGAWHFAPIKWNSDAATSVSIVSPEGEVISYKTIDFDKHGRYSIGKALEAALGPQKKNDMRHYKALLAESKKVGWPVSYATDLTTHDERELRHRDPDMPFGWILRELGTHLILPETGYDSPAQAPGARYVASMKSSYGDLQKSCRFYRWDGHTLTLTSPEKWAEWVDKKHKFLRGESNDE